MTDAKPLHDPGARGFASDSYAGIHPEILEAVARANGGHQAAYGADVCSQHLQSETGEVRWMTSFDTTEADVDGFAVALRDELATDRSR